MTLCMVERAALYRKYSAARIHMSATALRMLLKVKESSNGRSSMPIRATAEATMAHQNTSLSACLADFSPASIFQRDLPSASCFVPPLASGSDDSSDFRLSHRSEERRVGKES